MTIFPGTNYFARSLARVLAALGPTCQTKSVYTHSSDTLLRGAQLVISDALPATNGFREFTRFSYRLFIVVYMLYVFWVTNYYSSCLFSLLSMPVYETEVSQFFSYEIFRYEIGVIGKPLD